MSQSTHPKDTMKTNTPFADMTGEVTEMQKDAIELMVNSVPQFAGAANLAAHPMGAMAAASAIGMAMASQMFGLFAGTMAGAIQAANALANDTTGGRSEPLGMANPLGFDPATGSFDETKEADRAAHRPVAGKTVKADAPKAKPAVVETLPAAAARAASAKTAAKSAAEPVVFAPAAPAKPAKAEPANARPAKAEAKAPAKKTAKPAAKTAAKAPVTKAEHKPTAGKTTTAKPAVAKPAAKPATAKPVAAKPVAAKPVAAKPAAKVAKPATAKSFVKPGSIDKPAKPDDLKAISGVGPKLEAVLNGLGVWTYKQIAAWTPAEIGWVDDYLQFSGRIERDDWIAQAKKLAGSK